jgi:hypothetical protein
MYALSASSVGAADGDSMPGTWYLAGSVDTRTYEFVGPVAAPPFPFPFAAAAPSANNPRLSFKRTSLLLLRDTVLLRQIDHVHAKRLAQHPLRLGQDDAKLPRVGGAQHARNDFGAPYGRAREFAAQRVADELARQLRVQLLTSGGSATAAVVTLIFVDGQRDGRLGGRRFVAGVVRLWLPLRSDGKCA